MPLIIKKVEHGYIAEAAYNQANIFWKTEAPMAAKKLVRKLLDIGCHQTDIGDAFKSANPDWLNDIKKTDD